MIEHKDCNGCMALSNNLCALGYSIEPLFFSICYITDGYKPLELCPKPMTEDVYEKLLNNKNKR